MCHLGLPPFGMAGRYQPRTEAEFLALDETEDRIELIDGELAVAPRPGRPHRSIGDNLLIGLKPFARAAGLRIHSRINIRLAPARIVGPDLVVDKAGRLGSVTEAAEITLVCEVASPSTAEHGRLYAEARIPWYLLVEPDMREYRSVRLRLFRLRGDRYELHASADHGGTLIANGPFPVEIRTDDLLDF